MELSVQACAHTHACKQAHTYACMHACTHARTRARTRTHTHTHTHTPADDAGMLAEETSVFWPSDVLMMATGLARLGGGGGGGGSIPGAKNCGSFVGLFMVGDVWPDCCITHIQIISISYR